MIDVGCEMRDLGYGGCLQILARTSSRLRRPVAGGLTAHRRRSSLIESIIVSARVLLFSQTSRQYEPRFHQAVSFLPSCSSPYQLSAVCVVLVVQTETALDSHGSAAMPNQVRDVNINVPKVRLVTRDHEFGVIRVRHQTPLLGGARGGIHHIVCWVLPHQFLANGMKHVSCPSEILRPGDLVTYTDREDWATWGQGESVVGRLEPAGGRRVDVLAVRKPPLHFVRCFDCGSE